jgi:DNA-binding GntR family transcriptional regulator
MATIGGRSEITVQSLGEQVAEVVAREIVSREITPGTRLSEEEMAQRFGVSRTPMRDAFRILAREHLVTLSPRRGAEVIEIGARRVVDLYAIRSRLHGLAVSLVVVQGVGDHLDTFADLAARMTAAAEADRMEPFVEANMEFHDLAERLADNDFLSSSMATLGRLTIHLRERGLKLDGRLQRSARSHAAVFEAMRDGDAVLAEARTRDLILEAGEAILEADFSHEDLDWGARLRELAGSG